MHENLSDLTNLSGQSMPKQNSPEKYENELKNSPVRNSPKNSPK